MDGGQFIEAVQERDAAKRQHSSGLPAQAIKEMDFTSKVWYIEQLLGVLPSFEIPKIATGTLFFVGRMIDTALEMGSRITCARVP